jgi:hypothetical protein
VGIVSKDPPCRLCSEARETVEHVIFESSELATLRLAARILPPGQGDRKLDSSVAKQFSGFVALAAAMKPLNKQEVTKRKAEGEEDLIKGENKHGEICSVVVCFVLKQS